MDIVTLVNRTLQKIDWMYDGRPYAIAPLEKQAFPRTIAEHGKKKTRYGLDAMTGQWHYRLAIVEDGDNVDPIEPKGEEDPTNWVDPLNTRADLAEAGKTVKKFSNPDLAMSANLSDD